MGNPFEAAPVNAKETGRKKAAELLALSFPDQEAAVNYLFERNCTSDAEAPSYYKADDGEYHLTRVGVTKLITGHPHVTPEQALNFVATGDMFGGDDMPTMLRRSG